MMANSQSQPGQNGHPRLCDSRSDMEKAPRHGQGCVASRESKEQNSPFWSPRAGLSTVLESQDRKTLILNRSTTDRPRPAPPMSSPSQLIQLSLSDAWAKKLQSSLTPRSHTPRAFHQAIRSVLRAQGFQNLITLPFSIPGKVQATVTSPWVGTDPSPCFYT